MRAGQPLESVTSDYSAEAGYRGCRVQRKGVGQ